MKNTEWRKFAPMGLYLALLAALFAGALYLVQRDFSLYIQISLALMVIGLALFVILDPDRVRSLLSGRQARHGSNALVLSAAFIGILVVINYLAYENPKRWDLTEDASYTLTPETVAALRSLPQPVEALAFFSSNVNPEPARALLETYKFNSEGSFSYRFIDPVADPLAARGINVPIDPAGTVVLVMGDRQEKVARALEEDMTGALVRMLGEKLTVYFLTGHGEYSPEDAGEQSFSQLSQVLSSKSYQVQTLNLLANPSIPDDARTIVIAGPTKPVTESEIALIRSFVEAGGGLVVMLEPPIMTDFGDSADPLAEYLSADWGIQAGMDMVVDLSSNQPFLAFSGAYDTQHLVTNRMNRMITAFPTARSVTADPMAEGVSVTELIFTSQNSWAETDLALLESTQQAAPDEGVDKLGPVSLMAASENFINGSRVIVFGDADFASNATFSYLGNGDIAVNAIDWVSEQENLINLTPKTPTQRVLLPSTTLTEGLIALGAVFLPSGLVIAAGILTFAQRRRRG